jgi:hypothetical protein
LDLFQYNTDLANEGVDVTIKHPITREDTDLTIKVLGSDSRVYRKHYGRLLKTFAGKSLIDEVAGEEFEQSNLDLVISSVVGWTNCDWKGEALECTPENVRMVLTECPFIKSQIEMFQAERRNFYKASSET